MFKKLEFSLLSAICMICILPNYAWARHHHDGLPPQPSGKDLSLNPQQDPTDISEFAQQATKAAKLAAQENGPVNNKKNKDTNAPAALFPGHYTQRSQKVNGTQGWVNSSRQRGKYDIGINMPVPQTADPTQNKTRGVFRRSMPVYDPSY